MDTRLLPLIETLVVADADWLAFEILDGLGRVALQKKHAKICKAHDSQCDQPNARPGGQKSEPRRPRPQSRSSETNRLIGQLDM